MIARGTGKGRWVLLGMAIVVAFDLALVAGWGVYQWAKAPLGDTGPVVVDCSVFAAFVDQPTMPAHMTKAHCTWEGFQDHHLTAEFDLADVSALADWLAGVPTAPQLTAAGCTAGATSCARASFTPGLAGGANFLDVSVTGLASGAGVHVSMSAGDM